MSGETIITLIGNVVDDPDLRFTPSGAAVCNFRLASTPRTFDRQTNEWKDGDTLWMSCAVWRQAAENCAETLTKGMRVVVYGRIKMRQYEKDGQKRSVVEMDVEDVGPSLKMATAKVMKNARGGGGGGGGQQGQSQPQSGGDPWASPGGQSAPQSDPWASPGQGGSQDEPPF